ncbi:hypothetical protein HMPREF9194_00020 [Treponema maltophilum ATCC 51939]|uniref:Type I restriction modification DNA specificity domain-containing protein n=2 Tax=Treponema maltophilum ATCC 51939 TaxID=1125699 RepID=S3KIG9_TREMA|nr:restriction endonuclease subunit S [Treponema maltophilum]EPF32032.1 hypothetical protein HMPREF9194_00020 [Treponema maltophilum ATCC 51939]
MKYKLSDICTFTDERIVVTDLDLNNYISTENMLQNKEGVIRSARLPTVNQIQAYQPGDVLISNIRPYFKKIWYADRSGGCSNDILILRAKENTYPGFLYYLLSDNAFFNYATATAKGTKMPRGDKDAIMKYEVPNLPIGIQIKIADILSALDAQISNNKAINNHLEQIAQAIFKSWFVDNASNNWKSVKLGTVIQEIRTKVKNQYLPVLSAVRTGNLVLSEEFFTKQVYSKDIGRYIVVEPNDFAYNPARVNIGSIGINTFGFAGCVSPVYIVFRSEPEYHNFFRFFLKLPNFQEELRIRASGSVRQSLSYDNFALIQISYPPIDFVRKFNCYYTDIQTTLGQLKLETACLAAIRDTLLPRLMSGKLSVTDLEDAK